MQQVKKENQKVKGQVFTPDFMVNAMLDWCGYQGPDILCKHITDNSCGDGAFLVQVAGRYIEAAREARLPDTIIKRQLQIYIHGIDQDAQAVAGCCRNLDRVAAGYGLKGIRWRIYCMNSLACRLYDRMMDFVVGNPPYVRLHNLNDVSYDIIHEYEFTDKGISDLYLAFFELSFRMLKKGGQLCYITPISWLYSKAAQRFREYILTHHNLLELVDLGHYQVFGNVSTYVLVSRFIQDEPVDTFSYSRFDPESEVKTELARLKVEDIYIDRGFYLSDAGTLHKFRQVKGILVDDRIQVRNGFATLADRIFINGDIPDSPWTIPAHKASTGQWLRCFFPYGPDGKPLTLEEIKQYPELMAYLEDNRGQLLKRDIGQTEWWLFGRTQALSCVKVDKLSVNMLARDAGDLKVTFVPAGQGVFGGYYITASDETLLHRIEKVLKSPDFMQFVKVLKKYKSGGYYTFSNRDLEQYLHHCLQNGVL